MLKPTKVDYVTPPKVSSMQCSNVKTLKSHAAYTTSELHVNIEMSTYCNKMHCQSRLLMHARHVKVMLKLEATLR